MIGTKKVLSGPPLTHLWRESHRVGWYRAACGIESPSFDVVPIPTGKTTPPCCKRCLKWIARNIKDD